jgi:hypothetical protein
VSIRLLRRWPLPRHRRKGENTPVESCCSVRRQPHSPRLRQMFDTRALAGELPRSRPTASPHAHSPEAADYLLSARSHGYGNLPHPRSRPCSTDHSRRSVAHAGSHKVGALIRSCSAQKSVNNIDGTKHLSVHRPCSPSIPVADRAP